MNYDIEIHIGQQIENFLNSYAAADAGAMERVKNNLLDIYKNKNNTPAVTAIQEWDQKKKTEIGKIWQKAHNALETMLTAQKDEQMFIDTKEIETDAVQALNMLEGEYWDSIRNLILKHVDQDEKLPE